MSQSLLESRAKLLSEMNFSASSLQCEFTTHDDTLFTKTIKHSWSYWTAPNCFREGVEIRTVTYQQTSLNSDQGERKGGETEAETHQTVLNCWSDGVSASGLAVLAVVLGRLHLEDVGNDAVDGDVTDQACEEELFRDAGVHEAEGWETSQDTGQPAETKPRLCEFFSLLAMSGRHVLQS